MEEAPLLGVSCRGADEILAAFRLVTCMVTSGATLLEEA
jgi:hypothetical protein